MSKKKTYKTTSSRAEAETNIGTPTMVLLPATNYLFKVRKEEYKITIPREGVYSEIDSELYTEEDGEFLLYDEKSKVMYLPAISKILFAVKKYPDLKPNQLFAPIALVFKKKNVDIIGQIVEMLEVPDI